MKSPITACTSTSLVLHPFGMITVGRSWEVGSEYRYGFNGKESDSETYGDGNIYDYGFRIYNPRLGKFLSVDPLSNGYPWYTPYQFAGNMPIKCIDLDGLEPKEEGTIKTETKTSTIIEITSVGFIITKTITTTKTNTETGRKDEQTVIKTLEKDGNLMNLSITFMKTKNLTGEDATTLSNGAEDVVDNEVSAPVFDVTQEIEIPFVPNKAIIQPDADLKIAKEKLGSLNNLLSEFPEIGVEIVGYTNNTWGQGELKEAQYNPETGTQMSSAELAKARAQAVELMMDESIKGQVESYSYEEKGVEKPNKIAVEVSIKLIE